MGLLKRGIGDESGTGMRGNFVSKLAKAAERAGFDDDFVLMMWKGELDGRHRSSLVSFVASCQFIKGRGGVVRQRRLVRFGSRL